MSVQAMGWVIDHSQHSEGPLVVLLMIANHAKSDGTGAWPSVKTIAKESRMTTRNVQYCLRILESSGELVTEVGTGPNGTNTYSLPGVKRGSRVKNIHPEADFAGGTQPPSPEPSMNHPEVQGENSVLPDERSEDDQGPEPPEAETPSDAQEHLTKEDEGSKPTRVVPKAVFDPLCSAIVAVVGWDQRYMNPSNWGEVRAAARALALLPDPAGPEDVRAFAIFYSRHWPGIDLTPSAISKHYVSFKSGKLFSEPQRAFR